MRKKIEKIRHKSEKSAQDKSKTWVAMERKAQAAEAAKASRNKPKKLKQTKASNRAS